jgi:hypothetical protein
MLSTIMVLYIDLTWKIPFGISPHRNSSSLSLSLTSTTFATKLCHNRRVPLNDLLNEMCRGTVVSIDATMSCLCLTNLYRCGNCSFKARFLIQISSQNLILVPLLSQNVRNPQKRSLTFMRPVQIVNHPTFSISVLMPYLAYISSLADLAIYLVRLLTYTTIY